MVLFDENKAIPKILGLVMMIISRIGSGEELLEVNVLILDDELPNRTW
jgi:hypothetical protein